MGAHAGLARDFTQLGFERFHSVPECRRLPFENMWGDLMLDVFGVIDRCIADLIVQRQHFTFMIHQVFFGNYVGRRPQLCCGRLDERRIV